MLHYGFDQQNINWDETGHGLYMIGSRGGCYSHSQEELNHVNESFKFGAGDVIFIEYDPIDKKLRFSSKKAGYFELSIIEPPQNDAYNPFVSLQGQNSSVELIHPVQFSKQIYHQRQKGFWQSLWPA